MMMVLLDTQMVIWALLDAPKLPLAGRKRIADASAIYVSSVSLWEIVMKASAGPKKPISAAIAVKLGKLYGRGGGLWIRMQKAYGLWHAEREVDG